MLAVGMGMGKGMGKGKWIGVFVTASSGLCGSEPPLANGQSGSGLVATAAFDRSGSLPQKTG